MSTKFVLTKPFQVDGEVLPAGTVVDAMHWKNLETLVKSRYLKPVVGETKESKPVTAKTTAKKPATPKDATE